MTPLTNDHRAIIGVAAVEAAVERQDLLLSEHENGWEAPEFDDVMVTAIQDTLVGVAHTCQRFGLSPGQCFEDALTHYQRNVRARRRAQVIADGAHTTLAEARELLTQPTERIE